MVHIIAIDLFNSHIFMKIINLHGFIGLVKFSKFTNSIQNKLDQIFVVMMSICCYSRRKREVRGRGYSVNYNVCTTYIVMIIRYGDRPVTPAKRDSSRQDDAVQVACDKFGVVPPRQTTA